MEEKDRKKIEELIAGMSCRKDFKCYRSHLADLCRAEDVGMESFLKCLEDNPRNCEFSLGYGDDYYCKCTLRVYIAKKLCE